MRAALRRISVGLIAAVAASAGGYVVGAPATASETPDFVTTCTFAHMAMDDPIVMPRQPGKAMEHDFFGNKRTNAYSTTKSLRAGGGTTCSTPADTSAYWTPTILDHGKIVMPTRVKAYYRLGTKTPDGLQPFPAGLVMIAGNEMATSYQSTRVASWGCGQSNDGTAAVPTCSGPTLTLHIYFPDCWDGKHLDSSDHMSHMAVTHNGQCPSTHPVKLPKLTEDVKYPINGDSSVQFVYSHNAYPGHADFMQAWDQNRLAQLVRDCLQAGRSCGVITN